MILAGNMRLNAFFFIFCNGSNYFFKTSLFFLYDYSHELLNYNFDKYQMLWIQ